MARARWKERENESYRRAARAKLRHRHVPEGYEAEHERRLLAEQARVQAELRRREGRGP